MDEQRLIDAAREVLAIEARAVAALESRIDDSFARACRLILACEGRVVVTGMGKSGHVGDKIAATLASTGTPAFFVHPGEASHGDLGMITPKDVVLALSNSGETDELLTILPVIKRQQVPLIALTGRPASRLAQAADAHLDVSVEKEACPLGLAPTASTTAALAMGDALAVALLDARGFTEEDFARSHPAGSLGRRLLLRVEDIMHAGERLPQVPPEASLAEALEEMSRKGLGMTCVADASGQLLGVFTDGDLRRLLDHGVPDIQGLKMAEAMHATPTTIGAAELAVEALQLMDSRRINALPVTDVDGTLLGALNMHDLLRAGVV